jgi:hypothetical protein
MDERLTTGQLLTYLFTWLGASVPALMLACWGTWDITWDAVAAHKVWGKERKRLLWHAWSNLFLSVTFLLEAILYVLIGAFVVQGSAHIVLEGPASVIVLAPPLLLISRLVARRLNRSVQRWPSGHILRRRATVLSGSCADGCPR